MTMAANDRLELWTAAVQATVLSIGFALVFSWDAEFPPKALTAMILILLILIYAMPDRLNSVLQKEAKELHKAHFFTQAMILEIREFIPGEPDHDKLSSEEKLAKSQNMAEKFEQLQSHFEESFEKGFRHERSVSGSDQIEFLGNSLAITVYLSALIGVSALMGWLISLLF